MITMTMTCAGHYGAYKGFLLWLPPPPDTPTTTMFPALIAVFSTFVATVTLFFVSLSVPIIKSIDLFNVGISLGTGSLINARLSAMVDFGVWGFCQSRIESS